MNESSSELQYHHVYTEHNATALSLNTGTGELSANTGENKGTEVTWKESSDYVTCVTRNALHPTLFTVSLFYCSFDQINAASARLHLKIIFANVWQVL